MMQATRSPNGSHDIVRVSVNSNVSVQFCSYELFDPTWVKVSAVRQLLASGLEENTVLVAEEIVDLVMQLDEPGDAAA